MRLDATLATALTASVLLHAGPSLADVRHRALYPPVVLSPPLREPAGANLQHSLRLLAGLQCHGDRPVRVLFYGQSITEQPWWKDVVLDLRNNYPGTAIEVENRAIGGHSAHLLAKAAEADLYSFQPDLVIFHAYGSHHAYESIVRSIRQRTTADVLVTTDHVVADKDIDEEIDPWRLRAWRWTSWARGLWAAAPSKTWDAWHNHVFLPDLVTRYGVELLDVRSRWKAYLKAHGLKASQLLSDAAHLNPHGEYAMAEIVKPYLRPSMLRDKRCTSDRGRALAAGRDFGVKAGRIALAFEGTRAELVLSKKPSHPIDVRVNQRNPDEISEGFSFTRATPFPLSNWPALLQVRAGPARPIAEDWTVTLRSISDDHSSVEFDVSGSVTGPDGVGQSLERFVSKSGRILIEPEDWNLAHARAVFGRRVRAGFQIAWSALPPGKGRLDFAGAAQFSSAGGSLSIDAVRGLPNGSHFIELVGDGVHAISAIRFYKPPMR